MAGEPRWSIAVLVAGALLLAGCVDLGTSPENGTDADEDPEDVDVQQGESPPAEDADTSGDADEPDTGEADEADEDPEDGGEDPSPCEDVFTGSSVHEHAELEVYLDSNGTYDFSAGRYQLADSRIHFEHGQGDANGATIHVHEARPTLACLFVTLGWSVGSDRIETDQGEVHDADDTGELEVRVNDEPAPRGFEEPIEQGDRFVVRYTP